MIFSCLSNYFFIFIGGESLSPVSRTTFLFLLKFVVKGFFLLSLMSVASSRSLISLLSSLTLALVVFLGLMITEVAPPPTPLAFVLYGLMVILAIPVRLLAFFHAVRLLLNVSNSFPISALILFMFFS